MVKTKGYLGLLATIFLILSGCPGCNSGSGGGGGPWEAYTVSGTIFAEAGSRMDSDVNDTWGPTPVDNNSFADAQTLDGLPVGVSGYVNRPGLGQDGNSFTDGDVTDMYLVHNLTGNEIVRLTVADDATAYIDLRLYNTADPPVQQAVQTHIAHSGFVIVPAAGDYYVEVTIRSGATTYRLMIGEAWSSAQNSSSGGTPEFVPGEVLVKLRASGQTRQTMAAFAADRGLRLADAGPGSWIRLKIDDVDIAYDRLNVSKNSFLMGGDAQSGAGLKQTTLDIIRALRRQPDVAYAQPNYIRRAMYTPDDPLFPLQWHHDLIATPRAWDITTGSADVIVAVLDTGVLLHHPDLQNKLVAGYDFISDISNAGDGDGVDDDPNDSGDAVSGGSSFHGTHVAGIVAAEFDNNLGVAGVGGDTMIMPVRVLGRDGGTTYDLVRAILWAAGIVNPDDPDNIPLPAKAADIINMSFGGYGYSQLEQDAVNEAVSAGVILMAASGNESTSDLLYPAAYDGVVSISAVGADGLPAPYTNFGTTIDIAAPGGNFYTDVQPDGYADGVLSTLGEGSNTSPTMIYGYYQGTSMATPVVSGVAALMKDVRPGLTPVEFEAYLASGRLTSASGAYGHDDFYGYGLIDAYQAVLAAQTDPPTILSVSPRSVFIGSGATTADLFARKAGTGDLTLPDGAVTTDAAWLSVADTGGQADGLGSYRISVDRIGLSGGIHSATVIFTSDQNTVEIPVRVEVLPDIQADVGTLYLSLIDTLTGDTIQQQVLTPENGTYSFSFSNVRIGSYYLLCGSDLDNDLALTDSGEAVGGYPSLAQWQEIVVDGSTSGLEFVAGFSQWANLEPAQAALSVQKTK